MHVYMHVRMHVHVHAYSPGRGRCSVVPSPAGTSCGSLSVRQCASTVGCLRVGVQSGPRSTCEFCSQPVGHMALREKMNKMRHFFTNPVCLDRGRDAITPATWDRAQLHHLRMCPHTHTHTPLHILTLHPTTHTHAHAGTH